MKTDWTSEEVQDHLNHRYIVADSKVVAMLTQLAALLKSREDAKPVAWVRRTIRYKAVDGRREGEIVVSEAQVYFDDIPLYEHPPAESGEAKWKDPTGFSPWSIREEANNWTQRHTGKEMLLNYAACLDAMSAESREKGS
jgi:DNA-directed RNA polymerase specialized sigma24 family protein